MENPALYVGNDLFSGRLAYPPVGRAFRGIVSFYADAYLCQAIFTFIGSDSPSGQ